MRDERPILIGCGILAKEVQWLIDKNQWPLDAFFLDSALHIDFGALKDRLTEALSLYRERFPLVFYGECHPRMEHILAEQKLSRTEGQNCLEMLLGHATFMTELSQGAFFLLEDWAVRFDAITELTFGNNPDLIRTVFAEDRKYLLCVRTPCSGDFTRFAEAAGQKVNLPVRWLDCPLDPLESVLWKLLNTAKGESNHD